MISATRPRLSTLALGMALACTAACGETGPSPLELPDLGDTSQDVPTPDATDDVEVGSDTGPTNTCTQRTDCAHLDDCCYEGWCPNGTCQLRYKVGCCAVEGPCATSVPLHDATCVETCVDGGCVPRLDLPDGSCDDEIWSLGALPAALADLTFSDSVPADAVAWHPSTRRGLGGAPSLHAGHVACPTYFSGPLDATCQPTPGAPSAPVSLGLTTPLFSLPTDRPVVARAWLWARLERSADDAAAVAPYDAVEIRLLESTGQVRTLWSSRQHPLSGRSWTPVLVDLTPWLGQSVALRVVFETVDGVDNHHEGVYLGGLRVSTACRDEATCPPPSPCTVGRLTPVAGLDTLLCVEATPDPGAACQTCERRSDCVGSDGCDSARCVEGRCAFTRTLTPECCTPGDVWPGPASFETDLDETWSLEGATAGAGWTVSDLRAREGAQALRFGVPDAPGLAAPGDAAAGTIWSPVVTVPGELPSLRFAVWMETEWEPGPPILNPAGVDRLDVLVRWEGLPTLLTPATIWSSDQLGGSTGASWVDVEIPLDALAGQPVRVGWRFQTGDEHANEGEGIYVDDVTLARRCPPCAPDAPCAARPADVGGGLSGSGDDAPRQGDPEALVDPRE